MKELFGRPDEEGTAGRSPAGQAGARRARGARADVLQARPDHVDAPRPAAAGVHRGARDPAGPRPAADRGGGRPRDGAGARRAVGGRVRPRRSPAARGRHHRRGPPRDARERRAGGRQGAASRGEGAHRAGPGAARALRREGERPPGPARRRRHARRVHVPVRFAAPRARFPAGGREHGADARGDRALPAPRGPDAARGPVHVAAAGDARRGRRPDLGGARGRRRGPRPRASCSRASTR